MTANSTRLLSIIIPTLNEADGLAKVLAHTKLAAGSAAGTAAGSAAGRSTGGDSIELIVADCDSRDATRSIAERAGVTVVPRCSNRADAMNRGAAVAGGDVLLFLHADSRLPAGFVASIRRALDDPSIVGGAFDFQFGSHPGHHGLNRHTLKIVTFCNRVRFRRTGVYFGDQGIFVRRAVFTQVGGFARTSLFEDAWFSRKIGRIGRTAILSPPIKTCPRRFVTRGVLRQFASDLWLIAADVMGERPARAWGRYNRLNRVGGSGKIGD